MTKGIINLDLVLNLEEAIEQRRERVNKLEEEIFTEKEMIGMMEGLLARLTDSGVHPREDSYIYQDMTLKEAAIQFLMNNPGDWFSAGEIQNELKKNGFRNLNKRAYVSIGVNFRNEKRVKSQFFGFSRKYSIRNGIKTPVATRTNGAMLEMTVH